MIPVERTDPKKEHDVYHRLESEGLVKWVGEIWKRGVITDFARRRHQKRTRMPNHLGRKALIHKQKKFALKL